MGWWWEFLQSPTAQLAVGQGGKAGKKAAGEHLCLLTGL